MKFTDKRFTELLHELTQKRTVVTFSKDFPGMITVTVDEAHSHLGTPHGTLKDLESAIRNHLASHLQEE